MLREHGDDGTSTSRLADRAGVSKSVLYHHYDRDDLLRDLLDATLTVFVAESLDDGRDDPPLRFVEGSRHATPVRGGTAADTSEHPLTLAQGLVFQRVTADGVELDALRVAFERAVGSRAGDGTADDG